MIAVRTVIEHLPSAAHIQHVRFVLFDVATRSAYVRAAENISREPIAKSAIFENTSSERSS